MNEPIIYSFEYASQNLKEVLDKASVQDVIIDNSTPGEAHLYQVSKMALLPDGMTPDEAKKMLAQVTGLEISEHIAEQKIYSVQEAQQNLADVLTQAALGKNVYIEKSETVMFHIYCNNIEIDDAE